MSQFIFLQALGWALVNSLWQMAFLWVIYKLFLSIFTNLGSSKKSALATGLILSGFAWFLITLVKSIYIHPDFTILKNQPGLINENSWSFFVKEILTVAAVFYFLILIIPVWKFFRNYLFVMKISKTGLSKIKAEWRTFVAHTSGYMGITRKVEIWISELVQAPVTIGYLKPLILMPVAALNHLTTQQVEAVILHELSHIRRHDYLINLVINFIKTILYFNPFVIVFVKTIERERESSCDEMVMQYPYKPEDYATALLLLEKNNFLQMTMAATGKDQYMLQRVEAILGLQNNTNHSSRHIIFSVLTLLGIAFMNIVLSVNSKSETGSYLALNTDINPYYFFSSNQTETTKPFVPFATGKIKKASINSTPVSTIVPEDEKDIIESVSQPAYYNVKMTTPVIPELAAEDELNLKATIGATKKILEEKEWKVLENSFADAFNSDEKGSLKKVYIHEVNKINWNKLETQLRISYNNIDWNKVNDQVNTSLAQIKIDSIQTQLTLSLSNLHQLETQMKENNVTCIPDSDISLEILKENQQRVKAQLEKIKVAKNKKIIRL